MTTSTVSSGASGAPLPDRPARQPPPDAPLPPDYHAGLIIAITVMLAFSLAFLRYWAFETSGDWDWVSILSVAALVLSVLLQLVALFRALSVADARVPAYRTTVRWFAIAVVLLVLGVFLAAFDNELL